MLTVCALGEQALPLHQVRQELQAQGRDAGTPGDGPQHTIQLQL